MSLQAGTSTPEVVNDNLKRKWHAEEVQSERDNKEINEHTALANKFLCDQDSKQTAFRVYSGAYKNNSNVVQASMRSSITNNEATSTYQIP